jgi:DNA-binding transcriptional MocR family regulator
MSVRPLRVPAPTISGGTAREIAASIERLIRDGEYATGQRLPPIRILAGELGVSAMTVTSAYSDLRRRGIVTSAGRAGTRVSPNPPLLLAPRAPVPAGARDLTIGNPDPELLPQPRAALAGISPQPRAQPVDNKVGRLLELAAARFAADGIPNDALAVVGGALDGVERALGAHLVPGDKIAVEDPVFIRVLDLIRALGLVPLPVAVDDDGPRPDELQAALSAGASAFVLTPRWQNPFGARLTAGRAAALLDVLAKREEVVVIEDDHAGLVAAEPVHSLTRGRDRWASVRSVSKALGGDYRIALVSGDRTTISRIEGRQLLGTGWVSHLLQEVVAGLWADPDVQAGLAEAAGIYDTRRQAFLLALAERGISAHGASGLNVWIPVAAEAATVTSLLQRGWAIAAGERFRLRAGPAVRVTTATLTTEETTALADDLADVLTMRVATYSS